VSLYEIYYMNNQIWEFVREDGKGLPLRVEVEESILGSGGDCNLLVMHPSVDQQHARLTIQPDGLTIEDLNSRKGIFVEGQSVDSIRLSADEGGEFVVIFGEICFFVSRVEAALPPPAPSISIPPPIPDSGKKHKVIKIRSSGIQSEAEPSKQPNKSDSIWYFKHGSTQNGPMTIERLFETFDEGQISKNDMVWKEGDHDPKPAWHVIDEPFPEESSVQIKTSLSPVDSAVTTPAQSTDLQGPGMADAGHGSAVCPCCWYKFEPDEVYFISMHPDLIGDPVVGEFEQLRFLPERFTPDGLALDAKGMRCTDMACPRCHMRVPSQVLHSDPFFLSIVGAPGSGKSHVLAAAIWRLREVMPSQLDFSFNDVDAVTNQWLNEYEERLFFDQENERLNVIKKTEQTAEHVFKKAIIQGIETFLPMPCLFSFSPTDESGPPKNCMVLYDNAGESFQVGNDTVNQPGTQHLVRSKGVLFLYDPQADPRMLKHLRTVDKAKAESNQTLQRQDVLMVEMMARIRRHAGLTEGEHYDNTLIIALSKSDLFGETFDLDTPVLKEDPDTWEKVLDMTVIAEMSYKTRTLLKRFSPEVVNNAESFASKVLYLPVSALGHNPDDQGILTEAFKPGWVEVPFLYFLANSGLMPSFRPSAPAEADTAFVRKGHLLRFQSAETGRTHEVPWQFSGYELTCEETSKRFRVPYLAEAPQL